MWVYPASCESCLSKEGMGSQKGRAEEGGLIGCPRGRLRCVQWRAAPLRAHESGSVACNGGWLHSVPTRAAPLRSREGGSFACPRGWLLCMLSRAALLGGVIDWHAEYLSIPSRSLRLID